VAATGGNRNGGDGRAVQRRLFVLQRGRVGPGVDTVVVRCVRLHCRLSRTVIDLGLSVASLVPLVEERRNRDRGQQAENEHDDQELDERETRLFLGHPLTELEEHLLPPWTFRFRQAPDRKSVR